jgi:hypothetical protein
MENQQDISAKDIKIVIANESHEGYAQQQVSPSVTLIM